MAHLTSMLAQHALSIDIPRLGPGVKETALRCVLDLLGSAIAGIATAGPVATRAASAQTLGPGAASIWMSGCTASPLSALLVNGSAACALDLDDGNRSARGHPGACVIPTVLTLSSTQPRVSADDVLAAIIAGYDVGVRIAAAQNPAVIATRQTGRWGAYAAAAAAGRLLRADPLALAQALAIAGVLAPNQRANGSSGYSRVTGNLVKEGIAWSAALGVQALYMAIHGYTGPIDILDHGRFYDARRICRGLGRRWEILDTYFKPYACCRYIHPALDAFFHLQDQYGFRALEIDRIDVQIFHWALLLGNALEPQNIVALQYSLPYCLAVAAIEGREALLPISTALIDRPDLARFARNVHLFEDPVAEKAFPRKTLARVIVTTRQGQRLVSPRVAPVGDPDRPMPQEAIENKFRLVTRHSISPAKQEALIASVSALGNGSSDDLLRELASGS